MTVEYTIQITQARSADDKRIIGKKVKVTFVNDLGETKIVALKNYFDGETDNPTTIGDVISTYVNRIGHDYTNNHNNKSISIKTELIGF